MVGKTIIVFHIGAAVLDITLALAHQLKALFFRKFASKRALTSSPTCRFRLSESDLVIIM